jgi:hypothetical protein
VGVESEGDETLKDVESPGLKTLTEEKTMLESNLAWVLLQFFE